MQPLEESEASWVPDYFGDEYLRLYQFPVERTDPEVQFLIRELTPRIEAGGTILDLACGQGRHSLGLAGAGFRVTGLDYQQNLLDLARQEARARQVDIEFIRGDMRQLPFTGAFDAVINMFTAFGYFSDMENALVLNEVSRALRPGGWLVLDVANRDAMLRQALPRSWKRLPDGALVLSEWSWDTRTGRYTHRQELIDEQAGTRRSFTHSVRVYTCPELEVMLQQSGMTLLAVHGGFRGEMLTLDAPRLVCIAQKLSSQDG